MTAEKIIIRPVYVEITREDLPLDGSYRNPEEKYIFEARFAWEAGTQSWDYKDFRGYGASEEEAVAALYQEKGKAIALTFACAHCGTLMQRKYLTESEIYKGKLICKNPMPCIYRKLRRDGK